MALALFLGAVGPARAGSVLYTLKDTAKGVSATALFTPVPGGIEITLTNTESKTPDAGHAISQLQFTVGGALGLPTAFTEVAGTETDFKSPPTAVDAKPPTKAQHWSFKASASAVDLWTVDSPGLSGYGHQPNHLIVASGSAPDASLTNSHLPSFIGPADYFLADPTVPSTLTLSDVTGAAFSFGTGPEVKFESGTGSVVPNGSPNGSPDTPPVPEPASLTLLGLGGLGLTGYAWRRRRTRFARPAA
jgi:hypothetical protein